MARRVGDERPSKQAQVMSQKDLLAILASIAATKSKMKEERDALGERVARAVADKNFHTGAGAVAAKLQKWLDNDDITKAVAFVANLDAYIDHLGIREMDLFAAQEPEPEEKSNVQDLRPRFKRRGKNGSGHSTEAT